MKIKKVENSQKPCGSTKIHNARFYNLAPRGIICMDYNNINQKLAVARSDSSIELWDMKHTPFQEKGTPALGKEYSIKSIVWAQNRLFTAGFSGKVVEWNTTSMRPIQAQRVTGNAIWCLAVNRQCTELAIGTEEGYINIFDIGYGEFQYKILFDKQEGRVLCCSFDYTGNHVITGSVEVLRIWNARTGHALKKIAFPKSVDDKETIIWTLRVLKDFSIVAGDSRGYITVYDGHTGVHLESHQVLKADILALNVNEAEDMLICSGVEPLIRIYAKTKIKRDDTTYYRWVKYLQRAVHDHDVKVLLCGPYDRIISGGVDGYLGISSITRMRSTISRQGPFLRHPCAVIASATSNVNLLLLRYTNFLELWQLGSAIVPELNTRKSGTRNLSLATMPSKLLELRSKNDECVNCATISPNGEWLCYATPEEMRLFRINMSNENGKGKEQKLQLTRRKSSRMESISATHAQFTTDSRSLYLVSCTQNQILGFALSTFSDNIELNETIDLSEHIQGLVMHFTVSVCGKNLVVADDNHTIAIWSRKKGKFFDHRLNLPRYEMATTCALTIHPSLPRIAIAYSDSRIVEYDWDKTSFICWFDQSYIVPNTETHCVTQLLYDARNPDVLIAQNDGYLYCLEKFVPTMSTDNENESLAKQYKLNAKNMQMSSLRLKFEKPYEHLVHTGWISSDDLLTISISSSLLIEQLPPAYRQKKYGVV